MSDTAVVETATPEAPATEQAPPAPEPAAPEAPAAPAAPEEPKGPLSKREARAQMHAERAQQRQAQQTTPPEEPVVDEHGRHHDPSSGKFVPKDGEQAGEPPAPSDEAGATEAGTAAEPTAQAGETAPETPAAERAEQGQPEAPSPVPVDPAHPIFQSGVRELHPANEQEAEAIRALLNGTYERRSTVESLRKENADLRDQLLRHDAKQTATEKWRGTPGYQEAVKAYRSIYEAEGKEKADVFWRGAMLELQSLEDQEYQTRAEQAEAEQAKRDGELWAQDAYQRTQLIPEPIRNLPDFGRWFTEEVQAFDARLLAGLHPEVQSKEDAHAVFTQLFGARLLREPAVREIQRRLTATETARKAAEEADAAERARIEAEAKQKAIEEYKRSAAETRAQTPPHPLAGAGGDAAARLASRDETAAEQERTRQMSPHQLKRYHKQQARQDAKRRFGQTG